MQEKDFIKKEWIKHWAGRWKLLNNSYLGFQYTKLLNKSVGKDLKTAMFISHRGYSVAYLELGNYKKFGQYCARNLIINQKKVDFWTKLLKKRTDKILKIINNLKKSKKITHQDYTKFLEAFYAYGVPHRVIKISVDCLSPENFKKFLPKLSEARVYAEPVYAETEKLLEHLASQISKTVNYNKDHILYITKDELENYWKTKKLPTKNELAKRFGSSTLLYKNGGYKLISGASSDKFEKTIEKQLEPKASGIISGFTAFPGKVKGKIKIIFDPNKAKSFKKGEILVTGMTRPEYIPLIKSSAGFITDAGGLLSHAAISARELRKPCIVGTKLATKILKDGDIIEMDANKGIIKILK